MPPLILYAVFETLAGLEVRPEPVAQAAEKNIKIFKQYIGKMVLLNDGSNFGEYITGSDDTPISIGSIVSIDVLGVPTDHITSVQYYTLAGVKDVVSDNDILAARFGAFYGFSNPHADY